MAVPPQPLVSADTPKMTRMPASASVNRYVSPVALAIG
jgi:hypothetical protein